MLPDRQKEAYEAFYHSTSDTGILDRRTTLMVQMASAMAIGCYP
jgi:hypothetical protein